MNDVSTPRNITLENTSTNELAILSYQNNIDRFISQIEALSILLSCDDTHGYKEAVIQNVIWVISDRTQDLRKAQQEQRELFIKMLGETNSE